MIAPGSHPSLWRILWFFTGGVALILLSLTVILAAQAHQLQNRSYPAYVGGNSISVYLRERPMGTGKVVAVLSRGSKISVTHVQEISGRTWFEVEVDDQHGWLPQTSVSLDPP